MFHVKPICQIPRPRSQSGPTLSAFPATLGCEINIHWFWRKHILAEGKKDMSHPLILQLRYARSEFKRGLEGLTDADARRRLLPMNCISWNIGHLAWQEQRYWLTRLQGQTPLPRLNELVGYGQPACTPPLAEMWQAWQTITRLADPFLDTLTTEKLLEIHYLEDQ